MILQPQMRADIPQALAAAKCALPDYSSWGVAVPMAPCTP